MSPDDLRQRLELKIVELIKAKLEDGTLTEERAQAISQMVLELLKPGMGWEELYRTVPRLDDGFPELAPVIIPILKEYEERVVQGATTQVLTLIREGQYDAATDLADRVVKQEVKLTWEGKGSPVSQ